MTDDDEVVIICSPVAAHAGEPVSGSIMVPCVECAQPSYVSPSSFEILAQGADVLCYACLAVKLAANPDEPLRVMPHPKATEQEREIVEVWRRRHGR